VEEARGCVAGEGVDLLGGDDAGADQRGEPLHRGEEEEADLVRIAGFERPARLSFLDQLADDRVGAIGRLVERFGLFALLAGEHQLEQRSVVDREARVGRGGGAKPRLVTLAGGLRRTSQLRAEAGEPGLGERVQQRLAVGEVAARRGVADAGLASELAQR
jgi:hypothetical protein